MSAAAQQLPTLDPPREAPTLEHMIERPAPIDTQAKIRRFHSASPAIKGLAKSAINLEDLNRLLTSLRETHHLDGVSLPGDPPLLLLQLPPGPLPTSNDTVVSFVWGWDCFFGGVLTASFSFRPSKVPATIAIQQGSETFHALNQGHFYAVFAQGSQFWGALDVDYSTSENSKSFFQENWNRVDRHQPTFPDADACFFESLGVRGGLPLTASDLLSIGWQQTYQDDIWNLDHLLRSIRASERLTALLSEIELGPIAKGLVDAIEASRSDTRTVLDYVRNQVGDDNQRLWSLIDEWRHLDISVDEIHGDWDTLPMLLWLTSLKSSASTKCGRLLPWIGWPDQRVQRLRLEPSNFPTASTPAQFWNNVPEGGRVAWGQLVDGSDFPVGKQLMLESLDTFPTTENPADSLLFAENLLAEAFDNKRGTIPWHATVELRIGPFREIEFTEISGTAYFVLRSESDEIHVGFVNPRDRECTFNLPSEIPDDRRQSIEAAVKVLLCAVVRDFWVVETRERAFTARIAQPRNSSQRSEGPRVVYLPRIRYESPPRLAEAFNELGYQRKHPHPVAGHVRRLADGRVASEIQLMLAERYGIRVPDGHTFVRPHQTGVNERSVVFRSRSALRSLYTVVEDGPELQIEWFRFERDVHSFMESSGFDVQHVAASGRPDHGIDVYATKGTDIDEIRWVIQAKCWRPNRKVGPSTVRELRGVLARQKPGTRGMIVTTSSFTSGARAEADDGGILLIDGQEFLRRASSRPVD